MNALKFCDWCGRVFDSEHDGTCPTQPPESERMTEPIRCGKCGEPIPYGEFGSWETEVAEIVEDDEHILIHVNCMPLEEVLAKMA